MTAEQVAVRVLLMCVSTAVVCGCGLLHHTSADGYLCVFGALAVGYGISFALALRRHP